MFCLDCSAASWILQQAENTHQSQALQKRRHCSSVLTLTRLAGILSRMGHPSAHSAVGWAGAHWQRRRLHTGPDLKVAGPAAKVIVRRCMDVVAMQPDVILLHIQMVARKRANPMHSGLLQGIGSSRMSKRAILCEAYYHKHKAARDAVDKALIHNSILTSSHQLLRTSAGYSMSKAFSSLQTLSEKTALLPFMMKNHLMIKPPMAV